MHLSRNITKRNNREALNATSFTNRIVFFLFLLFLCSVGSAQSVMDSLQNALQNVHGEERAMLLLKLSKHTRQKDIDRAIIQAKEAFEIAKRIEDEHLQSESMQKLGFYYTIANAYTTALDNYLKALAMERQHGHRIAEAQVLRQIGVFYMIQGSNSKALNYFFQALRIQDEMGEKAALANTLSYIGDVYERQNNLKEAASFFEKATINGQEAKNNRIISIAAAKAGRMLHALKQFEEATHYFDLALEAARAIPSVHAEAGILLVMSEAYKNENLYEDALALNQQLLQIAKQHESTILMARGYENLANIYEAKGKLSLAAENMLIAINMYKSIDMPIAQPGSELLNLYLKLDSISKAIRTGEKIWQYTEKSESPSKQQTILKVLISAYKQAGYYKKVAESQVELIALNKIIFDNEKSKQIAEMQVRYKTEQAEQAIVTLKNEQENAARLRNTLLICLVLVLIIAFLIFNRQRLKIAKNKTSFENVQLKQHQLKQDIEFKNKQLTTHSLNLVQKNEIMQELKERILAMEDSNSGKAENEFKKIARLVDYSFNLDKDWEEFRLYFESVHLGFFELLKTQFPDLTGNELRLSALVKLNLTIKEISTILNISPDSVKTARYRLRKKFGIETEKSLTDFLFEVEHNPSSAQAQYKF